MNLDPRTGLLNGHGFRDLVTDCVRERRRMDNPAGAAILSIHLDRLMEQDVFESRPAAERLIQAAGERLHGCVRAGDRVSRSEDGRYRVLLAPLHTAELAASIADKICQVLRIPFTLEGRSIELSASIGISLLPHDGESTDQLIRQADRCMETALVTGNCYQFSDRGLAVSSDCPSATDADPREALLKDQFELHYQPRVNLRTGEVNSAEALIRWPHPVRGMIPPPAFIPLAESTGLIHELGAWVLDRACSQAAAWQADGAAPLRVSVNVSGRQLDHPEFPALVERILDRSGLPPALLELEITESAIMRRPEDVTTTLHRIRTTGVRIALDDFGTGHSSLAYLQRFPLDTLKIDRSFIHGLSMPADNVVLLRSIVDLAHALNLHVVAEGVETEDQRRLLRHHDCDEIQGYLISPAIPPGIFGQRFLRTGPRAARVHSNHPPSP